MTGRDRGAALFEAADHERVRVGYGVFRHFKASAYVMVWVVDGVAVDNVMIPVRAFIGHWVFPRAWAGRFCRKLCNTWWRIPKNPLRLFRFAWAWAGCLPRRRRSIHGSRSSIGVFAAKIAMQSWRGFWLGAGFGGFAAGGDGDGDGVYFGVKKAPHKVAANDGGPGE